MYGKIFRQIYDSTLADDWRALITFQQFLVLCDPRGVVDMTAAAIHRITGIPIEHIEAGIEKLKIIDDYSLCKSVGAVRVKKEITARRVRLQFFHKRLPKPEWDKLRAAVFLRDDYTCAYCEIRGVALECDHIIPLAKGGSNDIVNLITACASCNRAKSARTPEEWLQ